jgi:WD40 repeat protein
VERTNDPDKLRTVVHLWDTRSGDRVATLDHGMKPVEQLDFTPDGSVLSTISGRVVRLWSAADGRLLHTLDKHAVPVDLIAFSPSGKTLAVAAGPRVHWWNVAGDEKTLSSGISIPTTSPR